MNKEIIINEKSYTLRKINFNAICMLEELGFSVAEAKTRTFSSLRACFAFHAGIDLNQASTEIEAHIIKGKGKLDDLFPFMMAVIESDFFQNLS